GKGLVYLGAGPHANQGEAFDILLVAVTPAGSQQLTTYLRNANLNRDWPGEYSLPDNSQLMGRMTVTRR
ncbi:MAG: hypothetical protein K9K86_11630, partial [Pseudomonadales bacterium]|nr:hypothetical protein [Pseudomonadales bacterium]